MQNIKHQVLDIWKEKYLQNIKNRFITLEEALTMISNEVFIDKKSLQTMLKID